MRMLKACLNLKVVAGLIAVGLAIYLVAPGLALAALPLLVVAACPVSMFFMMRMMSSDTSGHGGHAAINSGTTRSADGHAEACCHRAPVTEPAAARLHR